MDTSVRSARSRPTKRLVAEYPEEMASGRRRAKDAAWFPNTVSQAGKSWQTLRTAHLKRWTSLPAEGRRLKGSSGSMKGRRRTCSDRMSSSIQEKPGSSLPAEVRVNPHKCSRKSYA